jgi:hypothetical protein
VWLVVVGSLLVLNFFALFSSLFEISENLITVGSKTGGCAGSKTSVTVHSGVVISNIKDPKFHLILSITLFYYYFPI